MKCESKSGCESGRVRERQRQRNRKRDRRGRGRRSGRVVEGGGERESVRVRLSDRVIPSVSE